MRMRYNSKIREEIKKIVIDSCHHPTAEDVYQQLLVLGFNYSISTVYRNLHQLSEEGTILELVMPNGKMHYDGKTFFHHHAYCLKCKKIFDLHLNEMKLKNSIYQEIGMNTIDYHILVRGICRDCEEENE